MFGFGIFRIFEIGRAAIFCVCGELVVNTADFFTWSRASGACSLPSPGGALSGLNSLLTKFNVAFKNLTLRPAADVSGEARLAGSWK